MKGAFAKLAEVAEEFMRTQRRARPFLALVNGSPAGAMASIVSLTDEDRAIVFEVARAAIALMEEYDVGDEWVRSGDVAPHTVYVDPVTDRLIVGPRP